VSFVLEEATEMAQVHPTMKTKANENKTEEKGKTEQN
jgi:hypothetical protein